MPRVIALSVFLLLPGIVAAQTPVVMPALIEMDVLDLGELPANAIQRLDKARRRADAERARATEAPGTPGYLPEESLGARGLAPPAAVELPREEEFRHGGHDGHEKDHEGKDDDGGGKKGKG